MITLRDLKLTGKRLLIREDLNVPMKDGEVADASRLEAALPTLRLALRGQARVLLLSHLGRPKAGQYDPALSLAPVAAWLGRALGQDVPLVRDWLGGVEVEPGQVVLCENVRFLEGEKSNDDDLARRMAALCDIYCNDAFATAHRAEASTCGIAKYAPQVCVGPLLATELKALGEATREPAAPVLAVVGGSKVSTKLSILESLAGKVDHLVVGGGIANTFLKAAGHPIGQSLCEDELIEVARRMLQAGAAQRASIPLPVDVVVAREFAPQAEGEVKAVEAVGPEDLILDVGPRTRARIAELVAQARTIIWNGPLGVFEFEHFGEGTRALAKAIAASGAFSLAGGGDTLAAIARYGVGTDISYISTGGGAFLEFLEGKSLPAVEILEERFRVQPGSVHPSEGY